MVRSLTPVSSATRRTAVLTALRSAILSGELMPGDRLTEVQLAAELGVSRPTLREAIYQLVNEGLLVHEAYKGVSVAQIDQKGIDDIAVVRTALETIAARAIASSKDEAPRDALRTAWREYDEAALSGDPDRENEAHLALHETIWVASGNSMLSRIWPIVAASVHLALSTDVATRRDTPRSREKHEELVQSILDNNRRNITAIVRSHIEDSAAELLELLSDTRLTHSPDRSR